MKRFFYILLLFIVGFTVTDVQQEVVVLNWNKTSNQVDINNGNRLLTFENASFDSNIPGIPVYTKKIQLQAPNQDYLFSVENEVIEEIQQPGNYFIPNNLPSGFTIQKTILKSGNSSWIEIKIIPLKKTNGKIYVLKKFELKQVPLKSATQKTETLNWKQESVLNSGKWIKIKTSGKGIYKIPYSKLSEWGFSNPAQVRVFGSGGTQLSENLTDVEYDDLEQNAVWHGSNNGTDCLFFYEPGNIRRQPDPSKKYFEHKNDDYSNHGFFFLSENAGNQKIIEAYPELQKPPTHQVSNFHAYELHELDEYNLLHSGKQWFGEKFINGTSKNFTFDVTNASVDSDISIQISGAARSFEPSKISIQQNSKNVGDLNFYKVNTGDVTTLYADSRSQRYQVAVSGSQLALNLTYIATNSNAEAWLDFVEINFSKKLQVENSPLFFRELKSVIKNAVVEFTVDNAASSTKVWDVTDINDVKEVPFLLEGNIARIKRPADELREYVVFNQNSDFLEPELVGEVKNQNLHGINTPDFVIITHANFLGSANALAAFHRDYDGMNVEVVQAEQVFNEFSSGKRSATGIRNFIKMLYDRNEGLKYVLLLGDGSFDNKNINQSCKNFIPTFQSDTSLNPVASFVTDDYFVILDSGESVYNGAVDLGIGRIPASTAFEAELVVNKILNYYSPEALGSWRNVVCFIGDDEDGNLHMSDSERLADIVNENHKQFVTDKIYFDAFMEEATPAGERYPAVTEAINNRVKEGVLVLNYVGHANERFLADEHVLDVSDINSWSNAKTLPIFVTATCEFSRFDADDTSAGEYVLFNPSGGGIGLFSTTRVVFAYANFKLSQSFYNFIFQKDENGNNYRMGDVMRLAKINTINTTNKRNFTLLADPALKLSYPKYNVVTTTINQQNAAGVPDTIGALQKITITGYISDNAGNKLNSFSGQITPIVYDKEIVMQTLGNGGERPMDFKVQENIIYKGLASVTNGDFTFSFVIPKDISYNPGEGKVVYYAENNQDDAHGAFENFVIGGSGSQVTDNQGPNIELFMDSPDFVSGDETSKNPTLLANISDENGINTVGTGIGHDITAILDDNYSNVLILNNYYQAELDDFTRGSIRFPLKNLSVGKHTLKLKAWDVANNSSEVEIEFIVSGDFTIQKVSNYPNPVNEYTFFTFSHNQSDATLNTIIEVFDQTGRRIDMLREQIGSNGLNSNPVRWDMTALKGTLRSGIYIYRVTAQNNDGVIASKSGKIVIAR